MFLKAFIDQISQEKDGQDLNKAEKRAEKEPNRGKANPEVMVPRAE